ncbi:MAG: alpha/beta fold hydrolase [Acidimicrobiales bacterium]|nr:alpha/beta fold hydrolase [Acidimicrobiales bacterium]
MALADVETAPPDFPPGRAVSVPPRGRTWVYDSGPASGPALVLLHGWTSTAALNWYRCFPALQGGGRVVALDLRGHGRGIRSRLPFRLEDCADDVAALIQALGLGPSTIVGYSMGGPVAQLLWRRHREVVSGLVLCATAARFASRGQWKGPMGTMGLGASVAISLLPGALRRRGMAAATRNWAEPATARWAIEEWCRHDPSALIQAGLALSRFDSTPWVGHIDVPTAVVVTTEDSVVSPRRQLLLAKSVSGAGVIPVAGDHRACVDLPDLFVPALVEACRSVRGRTVVS